MIVAGADDAVVVLDQDAVQPVGGQQVHRQALGCSAAVPEGLGVIIYGQRGGVRAAGDGYGFSQGDVFPLLSVGPEVADMGVASPGGIVPGNGGPEEPGPDVDGVRIPQGGGNGAVGLFGHREPALAVQAALNGIGVGALAQYAVVVFQHHPLEVVFVLQIDAGPLGSGSAVPEAVGVQVVDAGGGVRSGGDRHRFAPGDTFRRFQAVGFEVPDVDVVPGGAVGGYHPEIPGGEVHVIAVPGGDGGGVVGLFRCGDPVYAVAAGLDDVVIVPGAIVVVPEDQPGQGRFLPQVQLPPLGGGAAVPVGGGVAVNSVFRAVPLFGVPGGGSLSLADQVFVGDSRRVGIKEGDGPVFPLDADAVEVGASRDHAAVGEGADRQGRGGELGPFPGAFSGGTEDPVALSSGHGVPGKGHRGVGDPLDHRGASHQTGDLLVAEDPVIGAELVNIAVKGRPPVSHGHQGKGNGLLQGLLIDPVQVKPGGGAVAGQGEVFKASGGKGGLEGVVRCAVDGQPGLSLNHTDGPAVGP